ncbi:MAG: hypothetical protein AAGD14_12805 [Planctomycetota bacterium]
MFRTGMTACLALLLCAGCSDWTRVSEPPVPLSALEMSSVAAGGEYTPTATRSRLRLLRALAPGSLATLHVPDIGGTADRFRGTAVYEMLTSEEMRQMLAQAGLDLSMLEQGKASLSMTGPGGMQMGKLADALSGEFVLSLEELEFTADSPVPNVRVLAGITVSGAEHEVQQGLDMIVMLAGQQPDMQVEQGSFEGTAYARFNVTKPQRLTFEAALYRDALLVGVGRDVVPDAIARLADESKEALTDAASFGRCMQRVSHKHDIFRVHVDLGTIYSRLRETMPAEMRSAVELFGLQHMQAIAGSLGIDGKNLVTKSFLDSPGGEDFLSEMLTAEKADRKLLDSVPAGATSFSLFSLDGARVLRQLRERLPEGPKKEMAANLEMLKEQGIDLEGELLEAFGPRYALVTVPAGRRGATGVDALWNQLLGTAMVIEMRDRAAALRQIDRLPKSSPDVRRTEEKFERANVICYRFHDKRMPRDLAICIATSRRDLIVTLSREAMEQMLHKTSDAATRNFTKMIEDVPADAVAVSFDDLTQNNNVLGVAFMQGFNEARGQSGRGNEAPEVSFPEFRLDRYGNSISYTVANQHGIYTETRSPTGGLMEVGGIGGLVMAASVVIPNLTAERMQQNEVTTLETMRAIRAAQEEYRRSLVRDADRDGEGEFAFLSELIGDEHGRDPGETMRKLLHGFERHELGYEKDGYIFRAYLPAEDGSPIGEADKRARRRQVDGDLAESIGIVLAWPKRAGITGKRCFLLDGEGRILSIDEGYGGANLPQPDVLSKQEGNLASAFIEKHQKGRDGRRWHRLD